MNVYTILNLLMYDFELSLMIQNSNLRSVVNNNGISIQHHSSLVIFNKIGTT